MVWFSELLNKPIMTIKDSAISLSSILISILIFVVMIYISRAISKALFAGLGKKGLDSGVRGSLAKFAHYLLVALGIFFALDNLGISMTSFAAVGALLTVGIGFGLQNITQNFISGIIILIERPIKVGDIIRVGNASGRVVDIRVRSSIIETRDDVSIIVPNSKILAEEVISETYLSGKSRQKIKVCVAGDSDLELVRKLLVQAAQSHSEAITERPPRAILKNFDEGGLEFELRYWTYNIWQAEAISGEIRCEVVKLFRENKVRIPIPQRDLYFRNNLDFSQGHKGSKINNRSLKDQDDDQELDLS